MLNSLKCVLVSFLLILFAQAKEELCLIDQKKSCQESNQEDIYNEMVKDPNEIVLKFTTIPKPLDYLLGGHVVPSVIVALSTNGPILELGVGIYSTPLFHKMSVKTKRQVVSIESQNNWLNSFMPFNQSNHLLYLENKNKKWTNFENHEWGLVFIDHAFDKVEDVIFYANKSEFVMIHEQISKSDIDISGYKYSCKYILKGSNNIDTVTSILSNKTKLDEIAKLLKRVKGLKPKITCNNKS